MRRLRASAPACIERVHEGPHGFEVGERPSTHVAPQYGLRIIGRSAKLRATIGDLEEAREVGVEFKWTKFYHLTGQRYRRRFQRQGSAQAKQCVGERRR